MNKPQIVFMGTPEFALPTLRALSEHYPVVGVVTQPDRRSGRGRQLAVSPVKELAESEGIAVFQPARLRNVDAVAQLQSWAPDLIVVAAFGQILPESVLNIPKFGVLNIHPSLLPRWRGASPIQAALLAGDEITGVTVMQLDAGLDTGPLLAKRVVQIGAAENAGDSEQRLAQEGADLLIECLPAYLAGELLPHPQPAEGVTLSRRLRKRAAQLDWNHTTAELCNQVRAFAPEPAAYTFWGRQRIKILQVSAPLDIKPPIAEPGTVFKAYTKPAVVTGDGSLVLERLQMAGKRPMKSAAFLRGRKNFAGAVLTPPEPGE